MKFLGDWVDGSGSVGVACFGEGVYITVYNMELVCPTSQILQLGPMIYTQCRFQRLCMAMDGRDLIPLSINERSRPSGVQSGVGSVRVGSGRMVSYLATFCICLG